MILYKTSTYGKLLEEVQVDKANDKSFWKTREFRGEIINERSLRTTNYNNHFDTLEEAKSYLINKFNDKIDFHKRQIELLNKNIEEVNKY
jgi:hypothetical protein